MSLVTRLGKGSRLTVEEMDGNFLYLQDLAQSNSGQPVEDATMEITFTFDRVEVASNSPNSN